MSTQADSQLKTGRGIPILPAGVELTTGGRYDATELVQDIKEKEVSIFSMTIVVRYS